MLDTRTAPACITHCPVHHAARSMRAPPPPPHTPRSAPPPSLLPQGCIELLERTGVTIAGKTACVIGRSNIVGMPAALLLQRRDATVTMVHSRTPNAAAVCAQADIVIAACGVAEMVKGGYVCVQHCCMLLRCIHSTALRVSFLHAGV